MGLNYPELFWRSWHLYVCHLTCNHTQRIFKLHIEGCTSSATSWRSPGGFPSFVDQVYHVWFPSQLLLWVNGSVWPFCPGRRGSPQACSSLPPSFDPYDIGYINCFHRTLQVSLDTCTHNTRASGCRVLKTPIPHYLHGAPRYTTRYVYAFLYIS